MHPSLRRPIWGLLLLTFCAMTAMSARVPHSVKYKRQVANSTLARVLVGAPGNILIADLHDSPRRFQPVANFSMAGAIPSWMAFSEPDQIYAVDEVSDVLRRIKIGQQANGLQLQSVQNATGSSGVVHLEFNADKTRLVGSSYGQGQIDVWSISNGTLRLLQQIKSDDETGPHERQDLPHPHQAVLDPSGRFFAVNDLGTDRILLLDSHGDRFHIVNRVPVGPAGCGPRHGVFIPQSPEMKGAYDNDDAPESAKASHYIVVCELSNLIQLFELDYTHSTINFTPVQTLSTFGPDGNDYAHTAAAGAIAISGDGNDVYVSNRLTGRTHDFISHFSVVPVEGCDVGRVTLQFVGTTSTYGIHPRMFSLGMDDTMLFTTNQNKGLGLLALARDASGSGNTSSWNYHDLRGGALSGEPVASVEVGEFWSEELGPQFVMEIPSGPLGGPSARTAMETLARGGR